MHKCFSDEHAIVCMFMSSSQLPHHVESHLFLSIVLLDRGTQCSTPGELWPSRLGMSWTVSFFSCSEETHSSVAPLTSERGKRSHRNK